EALGLAPPRALGTVSPSYALRRYWLLLFVCAVMLAAGGVAAGIQRTPVYTASAQLGVGTTNANTPQALGGFASSAPTLAAAYSRAIVAQNVVGPVASKLHLTADAVRSKVVASVVPQTPVLRIDATASSSAQAVALANASSTALVNYVGDT